MLVEHKLVEHMSAEPHKWIGHYILLVQMNLLELEQQIQTVQTIQIEPKTQLVRIG